VAEASRPAGGGAALGRPATLLAVQRQAGVAIGIDVGKRHIRVAVADLAHTILAELHREVEEDLPAREAVELTAELVDGGLVGAGASREHVVGVGMGLAGPVHDAAGELGDSTILPGWV